MKKVFYCLGKGQICDDHDKCRGCPFMTGTGGYEMEVDEDEVEE